MQNRSNIYFLAVGCVYKLKQNLLDRFVKFCRETRRVMMWVMMRLRGVSEPAKSVSCWKIVINLVFNLFPLKQLFYGKVIEYYTLHSFARLFSKVDIKWSVFHVKLLLIILKKCSIVIASSARLCNLGAHRQSATWHCRSEKSSEKVRSPPPQKKNLKIFLCLLFPLYSCSTVLHCKKRLSFFPSPAGMSLTKMSLAGINLIIPV